MSITIRIKRSKPVKNPLSPLGWGTVKAWHSKDSIVAEPIYLSQNEPERLAQIRDVFGRELDYVRQRGENGHAYQVWGVGAHVIIIDCERELEECWQHVYDAKHSFADIVQSINDHNDPVKYAEQMAFYAAKAAERRKTLERVLGVF